ncbi:AbiH family protein [Wenyingzhuangia aestuarii]|uniref:AbiH family protein n=1 Tax=Wenyingzhuangia aestuarii TaxID=1647582 RepID=UPI00143C9B72|nr:AbiH family protein [Wenyingzhuangia aestuarii]NJB84221.1 hypothetical protein [Wenyingzhuangia aestuarii]
MRNKHSKNRIIIVGNGLDISHKHLTKYSDYAEHLITQKIAKKLIDVIRNQDYHNNQLFNSIALKNFQLKTPISPNKKNYYDIIYFLSIENKLKELSIFLSKYSENLDKLINNNFLINLYKSSHTNWFDIENAYFRELVSLKNSYKNPSIKKQVIIKRVEKLNLEFDYIKNELLQYLKSIKIIKNQDFTSFFYKYIEDKSIENIYIINFNYTNTINQYFERFKLEKNIIINNIHGSLETGKIIFGYGNDQNQDYKEIKDLEENEFLKNFKTFEYLSNGNYQKVYENMLDIYADYEVDIIGHSLSLCDKTLLQEIFDSEKCKKINLFKRLDCQNEKQQKILFNELLYSASRIISNEKTMRKKIKNFEDSITFP